MMQMLKRSCLRTFAAALVASLGSAGPAASAAPDDCSAPFWFPPGSNVGKGNGNGNGNAGSFNGNGNSGNRNGNGNASSYNGNGNSVDCVGNGYRTDGNGNFIVERSPRPLTGPILRQ